jgi:hypothetical protein
MVLPFVQYGGSWLTDWDSNCVTIHLYEIAEKAMYFSRWAEFT